MSASSRRGARVWPLCAVIVMSGDVCTRTEYHDHDEQAPFRGPEPRAGGELCIARGAAGAPPHPPLLHRLDPPFRGSADPGAYPRLFVRGTRPAHGAALLSDVDFLGVAKQSEGVTDSHPHQ